MKIMSDLSFQVVLDRNVDSKVSGVIAFGDFTSEDPTTAIYGLGDLAIFFRDLILGRSFPLVFVARGIDNLGVLTAIALFLHRDLAISSNTPGFLAAVTLVDGLGVPGLAHVDRDLSRFLRFLRSYLKAAPSNEAQKALATAVGWIRSFILTGELPSLPFSVNEPRIIERGTDGFVFASTDHPDLSGGWEELYRMGFLRGALLSKVNTERWIVLCARKSHYLSFDLSKVASALNQAEEAMAEPPEWETDGLWLKGPEKGTLILPSVLLKVLLKA
jgi:hypothetical protein